MADALVMENSSVDVVNVVFECRERQLRKFFDGRADDTKVK